MGKSNNYQYVIFDVDGTLLDTTEGVLAAVEYTIKTYDLPLLPREKLLKFIGPPIQESFRCAYGIEGARLQELATVFRNRYKDVDLLKAVPYEGIYKLCEQLNSRSINIGVATYKRQDYAETILKYFNFDRYSNYLFGADHENKLKKMDIIELCMQSMGVKDKRDVLMVGDSDNDALGAEQLGVDFLGVTYGFGFHDKEDVMNFQSIGSADKPLDILAYV